jgi:hypothetical protein
MRAVDDASCAPQGANLVLSNASLLPPVAAGLFSLEDKYALIACWFRQIGNAMVFFTILYKAC